jgi:hypothetical protein
MLQGYTQVCVAFFELLEKPHIFDGDDGLVCEGLEEIDLLIGEGTYLLSPNENRPDRGSLSQQRCD